MNNRQLTIFRTVCEEGSMTKDLALITTLPNPTVLNSEDFIKAIAEKLA
mgnify:CR=1 FL=1